MFQFRGLLFEGNECKQSHQSKTCLPQPPHFKPVDRFPSKIQFVLCEVCCQRPRTNLSDRKMAGAEIRTKTEGVGVVRGILGLMSSVKVERRGRPLRSLRMQMLHPCLMAGASVSKLLSLRLPPIPPSPSIARSLARSLSLRPASPQSAAAATVAACLPAPLALHLSLSILLCLPSLLSSLLSSGL